MQVSKTKNQKLDLKREDEQAGLIRQMCVRGCGNTWESPGPAKGELQRVTVSVSYEGQQNGAHFGLAESGLMGAFRTGCIVDVM